MKDANLWGDTSTRIACAPLSSHLARANGLATSFRPTSREVENNPRCSGHLIAGKQSMVTVSAGLRRSEDGTHRPPHQARPGMRLRRMRTCCPLPRGEREGPPPPSCRRTAICARRTTGARRHPARFRRCPADARSSAAGSG